MDIATHEESASNIVEKLNKLTYLADKIQNAKKVSIDLDHERQKYREGIRNIKKANIDPVWVFNGTSFLKTSQENSIKVLENDMETVENAIEQIREVIKMDSNTLLKLEGEKGLEERGFKLKPVLKNGKTINSN